jgi:predicted DNA-binding transcriptional regulator AlpA
MHAARSAAQPCTVSAGHGIHHPPSEVIRSPFTDVEGVCKLTGWSRRQVHEKTRHRAIPMRIIPGVRKVLFIESEVVDWITNGADLEARETADGGVVVRPKGD